MTTIQQLHHRFDINLLRFQGHEFIQLAIRQLDRNATQQQLSRGLIGPMNLTFRIDDQHGFRRRIERHLKHSKGLTKLLD
jgi:hypothetical protein